MPTQQEFIAKAKQMGKSKEETLAKMRELEGRGYFDTPEPQDLTPEPIEREESVPLVKQAISAISKGATATGKFLGGSIAHPIETSKGLVKGIGEAGVGDIGRGTAAMLGSVIPGEDRFEKRARDYKDKEFFPASGEVQERAKPVGQFGAKMGAGAALASTLPATAPAAAVALGGGALANVPFLPQAFTEGGAEGAIKDIALNTAIDLATFGAGKAIPGIKAALLKKGVKGLEADRIAKEAFERATKLPSAKTVKTTAGKGFKLAPDTPVKDGVEQVGEDILKSSAPEKTLGEKTLGRISESDRSILSEPLLKTETPYNEYAQLAESAVKNPRNPTPMDVAGRRGSEALDIIDEKLSSVGARKQELMDRAVNKTINVESTQKRFNDLIEDRLGLEVTEKGALKGAGRAPTEKKLIEEVNDLLRSVKGEVTIKDADNIKAALRDIVDAPKSFQVQPRKTITESIVNTVRKDIDDKLIQQIGPEFRKVNKEYADAIDLSSFLNKKLGAVTDKGTGQRIMGASLLKSSLQSNSDRGSKALFDRVKKETGIDLIKDAKYAEIAMQAVGDARIKNLLEEVGVKLPGKAGAIQELGSKALDIARPDRLSETVKFFNKQQQKRSGDVLGKAALPAPPPFRLPNPLGNQRGAVDIGTNIKNIEREAKKFKTPREFINAQKKDFHGTSQKFDIFDASQLNKSTNTLAGKEGFWFTSSAKEAGDYAQLSGKRLAKDEVAFEAMSKRLAKSLENAEKARDFDLVDNITAQIEKHEASLFLEKPESFVKDAFLVTKKPKIVNMDGKNSTQGALSEIISKAKKGGHDSVVFKNISDNPVDARVKTDQTIVFSPDQIKTEKELSDIWNNAQRTGSAGNIRMNAMLPATGLAGAGVLTAGLKVEQGKKKQQLTREQMQKLAQSRRGN